MIWNRIKKAFGWLLMILGILGVLSIVAHFIVPGVAGPSISSSSSPWLEQGFRVDCSTWWGVMTHLFIEICVFAWGWGIIHDMKKEKFQPSNAR